MQRTIEAERWVSFQLCFGRWWWWERFPRGNDISAGLQRMSRKSMGREKKKRAAASWMGRAWIEEERDQNSVCGLAAWDNKNGERWMRPESRLRQCKKGLDAKLRMGSFILWVTRIHHRFLGNSMLWPVYRDCLSALICPFICLRPQGLGHVVSRDTASPSLAQWLSIVGEVIHVLKTGPRADPPPSPAPSSWNVNVENRS